MPPSVEVSLSVQEARWLLGMLAHETFTVEGTLGWAFSAQLSAALDQAVAELA
jgi:hypothetical protein